jgi:hypothetical protein
MLGWTGIAFVVERCTRLPQYLLYINYRNAEVMLLVAIISSIVQESIYPQRNYWKKPVSSARRSSPWLKGTYRYTLKRLAASWRRRKRRWGETPAYFCTSKSPNTHHRKKKMLWLCYLLNWLSIALFAPRSLKTNMWLLLRLYLSNWYYCYCRWHYVTGRWHR